VNLFAAAARLQTPSKPAAPSPSPSKPARAGSSVAKADGDSPAAEGKQKGKRKSTGEKKPVRRLSASDKEQLVVLHKAHVAAYINRLNVQLRMVYPSKPAADDRLEEVIGSLMSLYDLDRPPLFVDASAAASISPSLPSASSSSSSSAAAFSAPPRALPPKADADVLVTLTLASFYFTSLLFADRFLCCAIAIVFEENGALVQSAVQHR
jgi:hypothetical protein